MRADGPDGGSAGEDDDGEQDEAAHVSPPEEVVPRQGLLRRLEQRHGLSALVALATFAALLVAVLAAVPDWREMLAGNDPPAREVRAHSVTAEPAASSPVVSAQGPSLPAKSGLSAIDLVVRDPESTGGPDEEHPEYTPPSVEITVHNRGAQRSVITRVVVTVEDWAVIHLCDSEGEPVAMSAAYDVLLPLEPATGTVLRVPVSQQQGSDEADRFALRFNTPEREDASTIHMYRLRFDLEADGAENRLPAGTAVVAIPAAPPDGGGYFWSEMYDSGKVTLDQWPGLDRVIECMKDNSVTLNLLTSDGAELSPELARTKAVLRW